MLDSYSTYRIWAPDDALWSLWAKPVLFARAPQAQSAPVALSIPAAKWAPHPDARAALLIDLPGESGVLEGLALARRGYRPVPLYNGVHGPNEQSMAVNVSGIVDALYRGAGEIAAAPIRSGAPPAFLLDANRMTGPAKQPGKYDNRWCVFPQDMPSASFLLEQGIQQVFVRADFIQNDLAHILRRYQEKGLRIMRLNASGAFIELKVVRPSQFRSIFYRFRTMLGLIRNAAGGFGGMVPEATQSLGDQSSGGRYYGIG